MKEKGHKNPALKKILQITRKAIFRVENYFVKRNL